MSAGLLFCISFIIVATNIMNLSDKGGRWKVRRRRTAVAARAVWGGSGRAGGEPCACPPGASLGTPGEGALWGIHKSLPGELQLRRTHIIVMKKRLDES